MQALDCVMIVVLLISGILIGILRVPSAKKVDFLFNSVQLRCIKYQAFPFNKITFSHESNHGSWLRCMLHIFNIVRAKTPHHTTRHSICLQKFSIKIILPVTDWLPINDWKWVGCNVLGLIEIFYKFCP